ncbi:MAG: SsrA-binding protein SmpB [bacterium]|nr:SsrA-binding protein SmpB [bacterium]
MDDDIIVLARNRRARHDYAIEEDFEAGIALEGSEVKSIRAGHASIAEAYVRVSEGEAWVVGMHVARYKPAGSFQPEEARSRRLLLHYREIRELTVGVERRGMTIVPLELYLRGKLVKLRIGLGRGRRQYDKRQELRRREDELTARRAQSYRHKGDDG